VKPVLVTSNLTSADVRALVILAAVIAIPAAALVTEALEYGVRLKLFSELQPVHLRNCEFKRYGLGRDEGYLLCDNLLKNAKVAYSYGIDGRDGLGCEISTKLGIPVHQYDCFNLTRPECGKGNAIFHEECVGGVAERDRRGRLFDTVQSQIARNNDTGKTLILKMDIEGAEWEALAAIPDETLQKVDQIAAELHMEENYSHYVEVIKKLKRTFHVVHIHFNNHRCSGGADMPFPSPVFQVLMVNKNAGALDVGKRPVLPDPLDEKDHPSLPDCQNLDQETRFQIVMAFVGEIGRQILKMPRKLLEYWV
jgi:hypothetical protein